MSAFLTFSSKDVVRSVWNKQSPLRAGQEQHLSVNCTVDLTYSHKEELLKKIKLILKQFKLKCVCGSKNGKKSVHVENTSSEIQIFFKDWERSSMEG